MSIGKVSWEFGNPRVIIEGIAERYISELHALNEYYKNVEHLGADEMRLDIDFKNNMMSLYANSVGCEPDVLDRIRRSVAKSSKGEKFKGLGILSFLKFARKMVLISKTSTGEYSFLEAEPEGDKIVTMPPTFIGDQEKVTYASELTTLGRFKWSEGSVVILYGVGQYRSAEHDFRFDMKDVFSPTKFDAWFQKNKTWEKSRNYWVKHDGVKTWKKLDKKVGRGKKRLRFKIPSKQHPISSVPGREDVCQYNDNWYQIKMEFDATVSPNNEGDVRIFVDGEDALHVREWFKGRLLTGTIYTNPDLRMFLDCSIHLKITPCKGSVYCDLYTPARDSIHSKVEKSDLGSKIANFLIHADQEVFRPEISKYRKNRSDQKNEKRCSGLKEFMDGYFVSNRELLTGVISTENLDPVAAKSEAQCYRCKKTSVLRRAKSTDKPEPGIYILSDKERTEEDGTSVDMYRCGYCGHTWTRRRRPYFRRTAPGEPSKPIYHPPGNTKPRQRKHGFGFSYQIRPFPKDDTRRARMNFSTVSVNSAHDDFKTLEADEKKLEEYLRQQAMMAILDTEMRDEPHKLAGVVKDVLASMQIHSVGAKIKKVVVTDKVNGAKMNGAQHKTKSTPTVDKLGDRWGAKVKKGL